MSYNKRKGLPVQYRRGLGAAAPFAYRYVKNSATRGAQKALGYAKRAIGSQARTYIKGMFKSKTRTGTRTRNNNVKIEGVGGQLSKFKVARPISPWDAKLIKDLAPQYRLKNVGSRLTSTPGQQNVYTYAMFDSVGGDLNDISDAILTTVPNATAGQKKTIKFMMAQGVSKWMMTNQDSGNVCVEIYDIAVRRDTATTPDNAFYQGLVDQATASGSATPSSIPGAVPTQSERFNTNFKILQKTRLIMGAGQSHTHYQNIKPNKWFNAELFYQNGNTLSQNTALKGFTIYTMIVAHGMPYNDLTTQTQVSTGAVALDIVYTKQLKYYVLQENFTTSYATNNLPTSFGVQEEVMQTGYGTKVADIPA